MKSSLLRVLGLSLALGCTSANASLIGDTITVAQDYPTLGTHVNGGPVYRLVQAGAADVYLFGGSMGMNPEANSFSIFVSDPFAVSVYFPSSPFGGLVISNIDDTITGFSVTTNVAGWSSSRVSFDAHSIAINIQDLTFIGPLSTAGVSTFTLTLNTASTPDSGATVMMLGLVVVCLAALRRWVV